MRSAQKRTEARTAICENADCRKEFTAIRSWQRYCAPNCRKEAHFARRLAKTKGLMAECPKCGAEFLVRMAPTAAT